MCVSSSACMSAGVADPQKGNALTAVGTSQLRCSTGLLGGRSSFRLGGGIWTSISSLLCVKGIKCIFQLPAIACYWKIFFFFLFLHELATSSSLEGPSGATLAPPCLCTHFLSEDSFPVRLQLLTEKDSAHLKTPSSPRTHLGSRAGPHLPCRDCAESRRPPSVTAGFISLLRHFLKRLQRTHLRELSITEKKSSNFFFQKRCAACLAALHKQMLANVWTNTQAKERERGISPACSRSAEWLLWKRWISWTMKKLSMPKF